MSPTDTLFGSSALDLIADLIGELERSLPGWLEQLDGDPAVSALLLDDLRSRRQALARLEAGVEAQRPGSCEAGR